MRTTLFTTMDAALISSHLAIVLQWPLAELFFRKSADGEEIIEKHEIAGAEDKTQRIRCPLCRWSPDRTSRWTCWDCEYPEFFYNGCGTEWNTFDTRGVCPTCSHRWTWTSCLSCWGWSKHEDWYEDEVSK